MEPTIGIDLGTTFSAVATVDKHSKPYLIPNLGGDRLTPSVIWFSGNAPVFGEEAKEMQKLGEEDVASFFKRSMGDPNFSLLMQDKEYTAEDLSALLLGYLKASADAALGTTVSKAVITVPAYFNNQQREATLRAGKAAGLEVLQIINEPTAAAVAYGVANKNEQTLLVYDLGGGTFDVTLMRYSTRDMEVLATDGDHELGGKNWDDRIINYLAHQFEEEFNVSPLDDSESFQDLLVRGENAKRQLSVQQETRVGLVHGGNKGRYTLSREKFEELTQDLLERTQLLTENVLEDCQLSWEQLDGVLLVGGSTKMPQVEQWVSTMSGKPVIRGINVDEAVAMGAALTAHTLAQPKVLPLLGGRRVKDVMSHSLGMVAENHDRSAYVNSIIIQKNKPIPSNNQRPFQVRTRANSENQLEVYMLQGESNRPLDNQILGRYVFSGIEHEKKHAVLEVNYQYDANGVISVEAKQATTGKPLTLSIEPVPDDVSWMDESPKDHEETVHEHMLVMFAVDLSGSMSGEPLKEAQRAAKGFIKRMDLTHTSVGLMIFADSISLTEHPIQNAKKLGKGIDGWSIGSVGYGNSAQPFTEILDLWHGQEGYKVLVVLTDGVWSRQSHAIQEAKKCHNAEIEVISVGFGGADKGFLRQIASAEEDALFVDLSRLVESLSKIGQELTSGGKQRQHIQALT